MSAPYNKQSKNYIKIQKYGLQKVTRYYNERIEEESFSNVILSLHDIDINRFAFYYFFKDRKESMQNKMISDSAPWETEKDINDMFDTIIDSSNNAAKIIVDSMQVLFDSDIEMYRFVVRKLIQWFINIPQLLECPPSEEELSKKYDNEKVFHCALTKNNHVHVKNDCVRLLVLCMVPYFKAFRGLSQSENHNDRPLYVQMTDNFIYNAFQFQDVNRVLQFARNRHVFNVTFHIFGMVQRLDLLINRSYIKRLLIAIASKNTLNLGILDKLDMEQFVTGKKTSDFNNLTLV